MNLELNLNSQEVASKLSEAIVNSALKNLIEKAVEEELNRVTGNTSSWSNDSVIRKIVKGHINEGINTVLREQYTEKIKAAIIAKLTTEKLDDLLDTFVSDLKVSRY